MEGGSEGKRSEREVSAAKDREWEETRKFGVLGQGVRTEREGMGRIRSEGSAIAYLLNGLGSVPVVADSGSPLSMRRIAATGTKRSR
eukprot:4328479-Pleurochrysis_carterae.AAC.1